MRKLRYSIICMLFFLFSAIANADEEQLSKEMLENIDFFLNMEVIEEEELLLQMDKLEGRSTDEIKEESKE